MSGQPVEKPGCALSGSRVSGVFGAEKAEKQAIEKVIPLPCRQLFHVHSSELKLLTVCYLDQASVLRITHRVFSFGVRKDPVQSSLCASCKALGTPVHIWHPPPVLRSPSRYAAAPS